MRYTNYRRVARRETASRLGEADNIPKRWYCTPRPCRASGACATVNNIGTQRQPVPKGAPVDVIALQKTDADESQERESSESPILNAFCRVAPSVLFNFLAIREAGVFLFAIVFSSRTSPEVHARRFFALLAIEPPFQMQTTCIPCGNKRKAERRDGELICYTQPPHGLTTKYDLVRSSLTRYGLGSKYIFDAHPRQFCRDEGHVRA